MNSSRPLPLVATLVSFLYLAGHTLAQTAPSVPIRPLVPGPVIGTGQPEQLSFSPDGRSLAVSTTVGFQVLDVASGRVVNSIASPALAVLTRGSGGWSRSNELCWSADGKQIARASSGIEIWDPLSKAPQLTFPPTSEDEAFSDVAWSPTGKQIAARSRRGILLLDLSSSRSVKIPERTGAGATGSRLQGFSWSPDGRQLAVVVFAEEARTEMVHVWDVSRLLLVRKIVLGASHGSHAGTDAPAGEQNFEPGASKVEWSPDGQVLAVTSYYTGLSLLDAGTGRLLRRSSPVAAFTSLKWSRDGKILYLGTRQQIRAIRRTDGALIYVLENREADDPLWWNTAASADGVLAADHGRFGDAEIDFWRAREKAPYLKIPWRGYVGRGDGVSHKVSPDGRRVAVYVDGQWEIHDAPSGSKLAAFPDRWEVSWSPDGELIVARDANGRVDLIRATDGQLASSIQTGGAFVWSPIGETVAILGLNAQLWRVANGAVGESILNAQTDPGCRYSTGSWSPDGQEILLEGVNSHCPKTVFSLDDKTLTPAPPGTGRPLWTGPGQLTWSSIPVGEHIVQSPNHQYAAEEYEGTGGRTCWRVWDVRTDHVLSEDLPGAPPSKEQGIAWSPDSKRVAYIKQYGDRTAELDVWDVAIGRIVERWNAPGSVYWRDLVWHDKLTIVDDLTGAVRLWQQP